VFFVLDQRGGFSSMGNGLEFHQFAPLDPWHPEVASGTNMKSNHKKLFLWSSLGSIAVGAAVALARRQKPVELPPLACRKIPGNCQCVHLWTERFEIEEAGTLRSVHDYYLIQPTTFKVWSVLELSPHGAQGRSGSEGIPIYHVARTRLPDEAGAEPGGQRGQPQERFYGVLTVVDDAGRSCGNNTIARGGRLEIRKCYVGGASNGVESGETHRSPGRVLNYRLELAPV
jgi:hypothetical protein